MHLRASTSRSSYLGKPRGQPLSSTDRALRHAPLRSRTLVCSKPTDQPLQLSSALSVFEGAQPIDRLRYQARFVFTHFDADKDGVLNTEELQRFKDYVAGKAKTATAFAAKISALCEDLSPNLNGTEPPSCSFDRFVSSFREQVSTAAETPDVLTQYSSQEITQIGWQNGLSSKELASAFWTFSLLDLNGDGYLSPQELRSMPGFEGQIVRQKLDVDEDDEEEPAPISFVQYLATYAKPRPLGLNVCLMAAHTGIVWAIFNLPISEMLKLAFTAFVVLQPHMVTKPVVKIFNIVTTLWETFVVKTRIARSEGGFSNFSFQR